MRAIELDDDYQQKALDLINSVVDYAIFRVSLDGIIESWNAGAERIKGYRADEVIGLPLDIFFPEADRLAKKPQRELQIAARFGRFEDEAWRIRKDGSRFRAHVIIDPIKDHENRPVGFAKITRDVSAQYELNLAREQFVQAQKTEIVGQLTGGLAHDFNNLLTAIVGCFDLIARVTQSEEVSRFVEVGVTAATRGQKLVSQLLAFARKQRLQPQPSKVVEMITTLAPLISQACGETIDVHVTATDLIPRVNIDQAQFQSALLNLVLNAKDSMPKGGRITIRTTAARLSAEDLAADQNALPGDYVSVEVQDTGIGMTEDVRVRATEPFFTTKEVGRGSGLGLSQAAGFALQSGGHLHIESAPGKGTTVFLRLPALAATDIGMMSASAPRQAVLVVEDNPEVLRTVVEMLKARGYETYSAEDATQALDILQREAPIDVLFTDIVMPGGINGVELAHRARLMRPELGVLLTSGYARDALQSEHGIDEDIAFLPKPYRLAALDDALDRVFRDFATNQARQRRPDVPGFTSGLG